VARLVIDPVTRIGGHLRLEAEVGGGEVRSAWSSGTMFRGIERVIAGRDPRDAWMFAERICGTCTGVHALASVRAVERAFEIGIPANARLIRNILAATLAVRDHVVQFYISMLPDWVDHQAALEADAAATSRLARSISDWPQSRPEYFAGIQERLAADVAAGQGGLWATGYRGHSAYRMTPEQDLLFVAHALDALDWQRYLMQLHALFGGRDPHPQSYLVGGMSLVPDWGGPESPGTHPPVPNRDAPNALSDPGLTMAHEIITTSAKFVNQVFLPDVLELAGAYPEWTALGSGVGRFMSFGEYPENDAAEPSLYLPAGRVAMPHVAVVETVNRDVIVESVAHAWYTDSSGQFTLRHPADGETNPEYAGPAFPIATLEGSDRYTWLKAARYDGLPVEVGPLARLLVAWGQGHEDTTTALGTAMATLSMDAERLVSTMGRIVARAVEAKLLAGHVGRWLAQLRENLATGDIAVADLARWDPGSWPTPAEGWSLGEGPRGSVGHWVRIEDRLVRHYQVVDATTWNASPRDGLGAAGPIEEALVGTPVSDPAQPLEILRTVHSFGPCAACAVHALGRRDAPVEVRAHASEARR
jgi:Ni,Fe-hydrogenase I large subunit